jgi:alpha-L-fucosidase
MYRKEVREYAHHREVYGPQDTHGYKNFIQDFKAEKFDAAQWVKLFKEAGARYVVPVAEHCDGFQMYASELSEWNAVKKGPHRDFLGELTKEGLRQGLIPGASSHRIEHWWFMHPGRVCGEDRQDPENYNEPGGFYWPAADEPEDQTDVSFLPEAEPGSELDQFLTDWVIRTCEIIDRYEPRELYFDWWIQEEACKPYLRKIMAYYYNRAVQKGQEVLVTYKHDACAFGSALVDVERGQFEDVTSYPWQTDTAIAKNSWCYTVGNDYKKPWSLLCDLADVVSKNGTMLLNVGPKADGTIGSEDTAVLREIGAWLSVNGEAIYGSRPWRVCQEGPTKQAGGQFSDSKDKIYTPEDYRFTTGHGCLYAICLRAPEDGKFLIWSLAKIPEKQGKGPDLFCEIKDVKLLGSEKEVRFSRGPAGLSVDAGLRFDTKNPVVFKISFA